MRRASLALAVLGVIAYAQTAIPIRQLSPPSATTTESIGLIGGIKRLADGRLLVNDPVRARLMLFDASLRTYTALADSAGLSGNVYPHNAPNRLYDYSGDSTLMGDGDSHTFLVIDPGGRVSRVMAAASRSTPMSHSAYGWSGFDVRGRLIHQGNQVVRLGTAPVNPDASAFDSVPVVRADFDVRTIDTIAHVAIPKVAVAMGGLVRVNPVLKSADEFAVLSDGSLAIIRAHDYHIDWIHADGTRASTPKMPFDWRRLTDTDKQAKIDSAKRIVDSLRASGRPYLSHVGRRCLPADSGRMPAARGQSPCTGPIDTIAPRVEYATYAEMPDYIPPIRAHASIPDRDEHLWILPTTSLQANGGLLYDVVNLKGEIFERVQLPKGRAIAGFGRGGIVYLYWKDGARGFVIEQTRILR